MFDVVEDKHIDIALLLGDGFLRETTPENVLPYLDQDFPKEMLNEYCEKVTKFSDIPGARKFLKDSINSNSTEAVRNYILAVTLLESRISAPLLTNSLTLIREMTAEEREALLKNWKMSPIQPKRQLYKLFHLLTFLTFNLFAPELHNKATGYPGRDLRESILKNFDPRELEFKYDMLSAPKVEGNELYMPNIDALIIGSGSGAGVVAHTLAQEGYKCLVLEKGQYYSKLQFQFDDLEGMTNLYENKGILSTKDQSMTVFAGSNFGGGSTVNWSASLKTPFKVRKEWYDDYGVEWAANEKYDNCMDYVLNKMGATTEGINHSFSNQLILDGSKKLGYPHKEVPQNIGKHDNHDCGLCHLGCKFGIKQGSLECWFRDALENGTQFMTGVRVDKILKNAAGIATGVSCQDVTTGINFTITGPKKFVVCGGSLQTPVILQNSGFRNKNIGANLKLHPVVCCFGDFGKDVVTKPYEKPILTSVCTEVDDLDGKAHGPKIETILHIPLIESCLLPWDSSNQIRQDLLKYNNLAALLVITRDLGSGNVTGDVNKPGALSIDYVVNRYDRDALREGVICAANLLYIEGAKEIIHPQVNFPKFISSKPKEGRSIDDKEFVKWKEEVAKTPLYIYSTSFGSAHQMSSCRISGKGPKSGACDIKGRLYECDNIYVADSSALPTASGVNPMVSVMALARLVSLGIANDLRQKAKF